MKKFRNIPNKNGFDALYRHYFFIFKNCGKHTTQIIILTIFKCIGQWHGEHLHFCEIMVYFWPHALFRNFLRKGIY